MPCSVVSLSLGTVTGFLAVALIAIAFSTDNWLYVIVNRSQLQTDLIYQANPSDEFIDQYQSNELYFTRTKGLFRVCFPEDIPVGASTYLSPLETHCKNVEYYIPDDRKLFQNFSNEFQTAVHMSRSVIALIIVSFFFFFLALWTGIAGCWRRSPGNITSTAILLLLAGLFTAGGMGLWHGVEYYEQYRFQDNGFYKPWPVPLKQNTDLYYDWSYYISWVGVGLTLVSSFLFFGSASCLHNEKHRQLHKMQYVMPMYSHKQQYNSYNHGYSGNSYPGPYYYGSQYGHYNY